MFASFKYESVALKDIQLDDRNPRIVRQTRLTSQAQILRYLYEHEELAEFVNKIAAEGKNVGAERPYIVKSGSTYTVIEGNTRIAAYKVLTGLLKPPSGYSVPQLSEKAKATLLLVDCSIAPSRDALLPIMANAHFGLGDKSKWGYLGSRKAVYDEWKDGKSVLRLSKAFDRTQGQIKELILEYLLYLQALKLSWTKLQREVLLDPSVEFNPPVRFLQTKGHKEKVGIALDTAKMRVVFSGADAKRRFKHLLQKLVIQPQKGLGATASYDAVFADYVEKKQGSGGTASGGSSTTSSGTGGKGGTGGKATKAGALFSYTVTVQNGLLRQLMKEAKDISLKKYPASSTFLLRNIVESLLKEIVDQQKANPASKVLDLQSVSNLCLSNSVTLSTSDKKIIKEFIKDHINYLNLGAHGNIIPNSDRVAQARDSIDQFIKKHI